MAVGFGENPVLEGVRPLVEASRDVTTDRARLADVASWLAYEELPVPPAFFPFPFTLGREETIDFVLVSSSTAEPMRMPKSPWELELRAHTVYACDELTWAVNALRPAELQVIAPQIDARPWLPFHKTHMAHHLTRTTYY